MLTSHDKYRRGLMTEAEYVDTERDSVTSLMRGSRIDSEELYHAFKEVLIDWRDAGMLALVSCVMADDLDVRYDDGAKDHARAVWHAAEFALGMLDDGYVPKYESLLEARQLVQSFEGDGGLEAVAS